MVPDCPFCIALQAGTDIVASTDSAVALRDRYPVTEGHTLALPRRHVVDLFHLSDSEVQDIWQLVKEVRHSLTNADTTIEGFNVGFNGGVAAGQTIAHAHVHVIPRRAGDTPDPRGGVRGVIPNRMHY